MDFQENDQKPLFGDDSSARKKEARNAFSTIGFAIFAIILVVDILQAATATVLAGMFGEEFLSSTAYTLAQMGILYFIGIPIGALIMFRLPKALIPKKNLRVSEIFLCFIVSLSFMYVGNLITVALLMGIGSIGNMVFENPVQEFLTQNSLPVTVFLVVIMAPVMEEFLCRKWIIDRLVRYGEWVAIFTSAVLFGLFHMNLFQFFYAYLIGLIFGYIYVRTGKLRYTILLHMLINFFGGVVSLLVMQLIGEETLSKMGNLTALDMMQMSAKQLTGILLFGAYSLILPILTIAGLIIFFVNRKKIMLSEGEFPIAKQERYRIIFLNPGMLSVVAICVITTILVLFSFS